MSDEDIDYYAALEVSETASDDEIRKAYKRLALAWHLGMYARIFLVQAILNVTFMLAFVVCPHVCVRCQISRQLVAYIYLLMNVFELALVSLVYVKLHACWNLRRYIRHACR
jgi:hypothetical protein